MKHLSVVLFRCHATRWVLLQCQQLCVHKHSGQIQVLVFTYFSNSILLVLTIVTQKNVLFVSLQFAAELADILKQPAPKEWKAVAEHIKIPFDEGSQYHPEFDGYIKGSFLIFLHWST